MRRPAKQWCLVRFHHRGVRCREHRLARLFCCPVLYEQSTQLSVLYLSPQARHSAPSTTARLLARRGTMMSTAFIPRAPRTFVAADNHLAFRNQMSSLERELSAQRVERDTAFTRAREAQNAALLSLNRRHAGDVLGASAKLSEAMTILQEVLQARSSQTEDDNFCGRDSAGGMPRSSRVSDDGTLGARPTFSSSWHPWRPCPRQVGSKSPRSRCGRRRRRRRQRWRRRR